MGERFNRLLLLLLFLILFCFPPTAVSDLASDKAALLGLRAAVGGTTLRWNLSDPSSPCSWIGVSCSSTRDRVVRLRLPGDGLVGEIPVNTIGNLTRLEVLSLRRNALSGPLPADLGSCVELRQLNLQGNNFSGDISLLSGLTNLTRLDISRNSFSGEIPPGFNNLTRLVYLNVSSNRLSGSIPPGLSRFDVSSFPGNDLCGSPLRSCLGERRNNTNTNGDSNSSSSSLSAGAIAGIVIGSVILIAIFVALLRKRGSAGPSTPQRVEWPSKAPSPVKQPEYDLRAPTGPVIAVQEYSGAGNGYSGRVMQVKANNDLVFFGEGMGGFNLDDLLRASAEALGTGTCGTTYKAYLENGMEVVVKRLKNVCVSEGEFRDKIGSLGKVVHENVVPLRGYYYGREEKLLVFDSMPMGSLAAILHGNNRANRAALSWENRSRIALQVATGIEHLHSQGATHGNIKSSNVLLSEQRDACISEFGLTQLVSSTTANHSAYRAPEVVDTRRVSQKADVYSFGILLLELLTSKVPADTVNDDGVDLPRWVRSMDEAKWSVNVIDPVLLGSESVEEHIVRLLHLGIHCAAQNPDNRLTIAEALAQIKRVCRPRS